ncbi:triple tyrosine motif-containing protein [Bacillus sp. OTU2372]|uniref:triple tyrosine motif-containing protein n=1 Tax=Bacillus sp. OTU2372 TaxID=3043858 RepID=UPI00313DFB24
MKVILLRVGLLTGIIFLGFFYKEASAAETWASKCAAYGEIQPNQNPAFQHLNCLLTNAALAANIPPEVVKAVAAKESDWRQFENGQPLVSPDGGIGIMQITNQTGYDEQSLKNDIYYNIQAGIDILSYMYGRKDLPKIKGAGQEVIENWYFPIMAYNGTKPINSPLYQATGERNTDAYQEKVLALVEQNDFLGDTKLGQYPFSTADFDYDPNSDENIVFKKLEYILSDRLHTSNYHFQTGDSVFVTEDGVGLRSRASKLSDGTTLAKNTILTIDGNFTYDQSEDNENQFVWYPVKSLDNKYAGYISSAYIMKAGKVTSLSVAANKVSPQVVGTSVDITATSTGSSNPDYRFYVKDAAGNLTTLQEYGASNSATWTPTKPGTYTIIVHAKDMSKSGGNTFYEARTEMTYQVNGKVISVNVQADKPAPQNAGTTIQLKAESQGSPTPEYRFYVRDEKGSLTTLQEYGSSDTTTWTPTTAGTYTIIVHAKDKNKSGGSTYYEARTEMTYQVSGKVTSVNVQADKPTPQMAGTSIQLKAASQGSPTPEYRFYVRDEKGNLATLQEYGSSDTTTWTPTKAGTYTIIVHAKDKNKSGANSYYEARKEMVYKVSPAQVISVNLQADKASPQLAGTSIVLKATSQGSSEPEYRFMIRDASGNLTTLQEYGIGDTATWTPTKVGTYTIIVHAKDKSKSGANYFYEVRTEVIYKIN